jgi:hypothetical protein
MSLVEYLFVDEKRLDSYFEQISSSPVAYDKVPVWEASLTITSPGAKGTQTRFQRPFTTHEKITQLIEYLQGNQLVVTHTPTDESWPLGQDFHLVRFPLTRAFIPPKPEISPSFDGMGIWLGTFSFPSYDVLDLFLLEDFQGKDEPPTRHSRSEYSSLYVLTRALAESEKIPFTEDMVPADARYGSGLNFLAEFFGAEIGTERSTRCLFRVRREVEGLMGVYVFGYPIFIAAAD